jgi:hypothetical protein
MITTMWLVKTCVWRLSGSARGVEQAIYDMCHVQVMSKYNLLFQYLLRLKRVGLGLEEAWGVLRRGQGGATANGAAPLWHVRHHMAHMINNLQIYVQVCLSRPKLCPTEMKRLSYGNVA